VREHAQEYLATLGPILTGPQGGTVVAFEHADHRFGVPALAVEFPFEVEAHASSVRRTGQLACRSVVLGGDDRFDVMAVAREAVVRLAVLARIGQQYLDMDLVGGGSQRLTELVHIHPGSAGGDDRQDGMIAAVTDQTQLGPTLVVRVFSCRKFFGASTRDEVVADMAGFQAGGIHRRQLNMTVGTEDVQAAVQETLDHRPTQQTLGSFVQGRKMRHTGQPDDLAQVRALTQEVRQAAIVGLEDLPEYQAGKQLRLRELLRAEAMGVRRQNPPDPQGSPHNGFGRFACFAHPLAVPGHEPSRKYPSPQIR
jgi:hypothetical protein